MEAVLMILILYTTHTHTHDESGPSLSQFKKKMQFALPDSCSLKYKNYSVIPDSAETVSYITH